MRLGPDPLDPEPDDPMGRLILLAFAVMACVIILGCLGAASAQGDEPDVAGVYGAWYEASQDDPAPRYTVVIAKERRGWSVMWRTDWGAVRHKGMLQYSGEGRFAEFGTRPEPYAMQYERHNGCLFDFQTRWVLRPIGRLP